MMEVKKATDAVYEVCRNRRTFTTELLSIKLLDYLQSPCEELLYDLTKLTDAVDILVSAASLHAEHAFKVRPEILLDKIEISKLTPMLQLKTIAVKTSGSTGAQFTHQYWRQAYQIIERDKHYRFVASELRMPENATILCMCHRPKLSMLKNVQFKTITAEVATQYEEPGLAAEILFKHGLSRPSVHVINFPTLAGFGVNPTEFLEFLVKYIRDKQINYLYINGMLVHILNRYLKQTGDISPLAAGISVTCERSDHSSLIEMQSRNNIGRWCDHMRVWDGGAAFFTCEKGTTHLMDHLAYAYSLDDKLYSTDYTALTLPFVRYWNGDRASIGHEYHRCECGRWYRDFKFTEEYSRKFMTFRGEEPQQFDFDKHVRELKMQIADDHLAIEGKLEFTSSQAADAFIAKFAPRKHTTTLDEATVTLYPSDQPFNEEHESPEFQAAVNSELGLYLGMMVCYRCRPISLSKFKLFGVGDYNMGHIRLKRVGECYYIDIWGYGQEPVVRTYLDQIEAASFDKDQLLTYDGANIMLGRKFKARVALEKETL